MNPLDPAARRPEQIPDWEGKLPPNGKPLRLPKRLRSWSDLRLLGRAWGPSKRGSILIVSIFKHGRRFQVGAVEMLAPPTSAQELFGGAHAHALIAEDVKTLAGAKREAGRFARKWLRAPDLSQCGCGEIKT